MSEYYESPTPKYTYEQLIINGYNRDWFRELDDDIIFAERYKEVILEIREGKINIGEAFRRSWEQKRYQEEEARPLTTDKEIKDKLEQLVKENRKFKNLASDHTDFSWVLYEDLIKKNEEKKQKLLTQLKRVEYENKPKPDNWITQQDIEMARSIPITEFVEGKLRGRNRERVKCVSHKPDNNPSCVIYRDQNTYHCFSCNAYGDVIAWIMKKYDYKFIDAVRYLLKK